jgi:hypothetical protein
MKLICYTTEATPPELVPGAPERDWMDRFGERHPYRCLPLVIANTTGWALLSPATFTATWTGGHLIEDIRLHGDDDFPHLGRLATSHFGGGVLTFHTGYLFRTEPGWDLWTGGAPNFVKDGIQPLTGVVETDWLPFPFTMNWKFTRPGIVQFKKGDPFCFVMPVPHAAYDDVQPVVKKLTDDADLYKEYQAWSDSRTNFLDKLSARDGETVRQGWQRHYFKGQKVEGESSDRQDFHVNRRRLKAPRKAEKGE